MEARGDDIMIEVTRWNLSIASVLLGAFWLLHSWWIPWSQDEGLYLLASQQLSRGWILYKDFAFQQMPLYPFLLQGWQVIFGHGLHSGRLFSFLWVILLGFAFWIVCRKRGMPPEMGLACFVLLLIHPLGWRYLPLVKPHALSLACAGLGWIFLEETSDNSTRERNLVHLGSGFLIGTALNTRLLFAPFALIALIFYIRTLRGIALYILGLGLTSVLSIYFLIRYPDQTLFNWFGYHQLRGSLATWHQWGAQIHSFFGAFSYWQWGPLFLLALLGTAVAFHERSSCKASMRYLVAATIIALPAFRLVPLYDEYFLPFLFFFLIAVFALAERHSVIRWVTLASVAIGFLALTPDIAADIRTALGPPDRELMNGVRAVARVAAAIRHYSEPDTPILAWWNGYVVSSERDPFPKVTEGLGVIKMAGKLSKEQSNTYRVATIEEIQEGIRACRAPLVVTGLATPSGFIEILEANYEKLETVEGAGIYRPFRCPPSL